MTDNLESKRREYYKTCKLWLPKFPNFRIFKFKIDDKTSEGKVIQIRDQIRDIGTLRKHLVRWAPYAVWYSSGCFLNPSMVRGTKTENVLLFQNLVFDIDSEFPHEEKELEQAAEVTKNIIKTIREKLGLEPQYILYSGGKGFHIVYKFTKFDNKTIYDLKLKGIDQEITLDKYRVIRLPLTIHYSGRRAIFIKEKDLNKSMSYIINKSLHGLPDLGDRLEKPKERLMTTFLSATINKQGLRSSQINPAFHTIGDYVTNKVDGTKKYIAILIYNKDQKVDIRKELNNIYNKYSINLWFLFKSNSCIIIINPYAFDKRRLEKIYNSTKAEISKSQFKKYSKVYFRISDEKKGGEIVDTTLPLNMLYLGSTNKQFHISKPHTFLLESFGFPISNLTENLIGYDKPKVIETRKRT